MFGDREQGVEMLVAHLRARADGVGMKAALDEVHDVVREAQKRVGFAVGRHSVGGHTLTTDPVALRPIHPG